MGWLPPPPHKRVIEDLKNISEGKKPSSPSAPSKPPSYGGGSSGGSSGGGSKHDGSSPPVESDKTVEITVTPSGEIKGPGFNVHPSYYENFPGGRDDPKTIDFINRTLGKQQKAEAVVEYSKTKTIPSSVASQIDVPPDLISIGVSPNVYRSIIYEHSIGIISEKDAQAKLRGVTKTALSSGPAGPDIAYMKKYGTFGEQNQGWPEFKQSYPSMELQRIDGEFRTISSEQIAFEKEREVIRNRMLGSPGERVGQLALFTSGVFIQPNTLFRTVGQIWGGGKDKGERILDIMAEQQQSLKGKSAAELFGESYKPGGFGFSVSAGAVLFGATKFAFPKIAAAGAGGAIISKTLPPVIITAAGVSQGVPLGLTMAKERKGELPQGSSAEAWSVYGGQLSLFLAGSGIAAKSTSAFPKSNITQRLSGIETKLVNDLRFRYSKITGRGMYRYDGLTDVYKVKPRWKDVYPEVETTKAEWQDVYSDKIRMETRLYKPGKIIPETLYKYSIPRQYSAGEWRWPDYEPFMQSSFHASTAGISLAGKSMYGAMGDYGLPSDIIPGESFGFSRKAINIQLSKMLSYNYPNYSTSTKVALRSSLLEQRYGPFKVPYKVDVGNVNMALRSSYLEQRYGPFKVPYKVDAGNVNMALRSSLLEQRYGLFRSPKVPGYGEQLYGYPGKVMVMKRGYVGKIPRYDFSYKTFKTMDYYDMPTSYPEISKLGLSDILPPRITSVEMKSVSVNTFRNLYVKPKIDVGKYPSLKMQPSYSGKTIVVSKPPTFVTVGGFSKYQTPIYNVGLRSGWYYATGGTLSLSELDFLDTGIVSSTSYWSGSKPAVVPKTNVGLLPVAMVKPNLDIKLGIDRIGLFDLNRSTVNRIGFNFENVSTNISDSILGSASASVQMQKQLQKSISINALESDYKLDTRYGTRNVTDFDFTRPSYQTPGDNILIETPILPLILLDENKGKKKKRRDLLFSSYDIIGRVKRYKVRSWESMIPTKII